MLKKYLSEASSQAVFIGYNFLPINAWKKLSNPAAEILAFFQNYQIHKNIKYLTINNYDLQLDIYQSLTPKPQPTVIFFHGGGWVDRPREVELFFLLPYLKMGFSVVNVGYRLAAQSLAPAAVADCRCALNWVMRNAQQYNFDLEKIIVSGFSAGGHLAMTTGMLSPAAGFDSYCSGDKELKVAAIVNWYGITDVKDLLEGANVQGYALEWMGNQSDRLEIAERVSPINYVHSQLPPIFTVHGDADLSVPYNHAVKFHEALDRANVPNQLLTIPGGGHGGFSYSENLKIYENIEDFFIKYGLCNE
ncbi:MAG: alpha/beta hydrolase [Okeania sp. SIO2F4]|uniref:alpha/beta hydrolase n=1 Tax=Okeania sp. SIO2F4 TaxID=2607790 RepID=UPI001429A46E|nr:alpha/beta hydrolase [Okeania sp. SIO2F4]NES03259.1 alpha/beta hydrolase [Okeania sp. SIO2F4]